MFEINANSSKVKMSIYPSRLVPSFYLTHSVDEKTLDEITPELCGYQLPDIGLNKFKKQMLQLKFLETADFKVLRYFYQWIIGVNNSAAINSRTGSLDESLQSELKLIHTFDNPVIHNDTDPQINVLGYKFIRVHPVVIQTEQTGYVAGAIKRIISFNAKFDKVINIKMKKSEFNNLSTQELERLIR